MPDPGCRGRLSRHFSLVACILYHESCILHSSFMCIQPVGMRRTKPNK